MTRSFLALALASLVVVSALGGGCILSEASTSGGGSCPCQVGNSGIQATLGCGQSGCVYLNGTQKGYHCTENGLVEDIAVCTASAGGGPGSAGSSSGASGSAGAPVGTAGATGACVPRTCMDIPDSCGTPDDGCGKKLVCGTCIGGKLCSPSGACFTPAQNVIVVGNYQGGTFNLIVDKHLPALGIGLVSYRPMHVTISGEYASDVVVVSHAGYQEGSTVTGVAPHLTSDVYLPSPDGKPQNAIASDLPSNTVQDTRPLVEGYFKDLFGSTSVVLHVCQYSAYTGDLSVSVGGECP